MQYQFELVNSALWGQTAVSAYLYSRQMLPTNVGCDKCRLPKSPFISYSCIPYFGHACLKLNLVLLSLLTGEYATRNLKYLRNSSTSLWTC